MVNQFLFAHSALDTALSYRTKVFEKKKKKELSTHQVIDACMRLGVGEMDVVAACSVNENQSRHRDINKDESIVELVVETGSQEESGVAELSKNERLGTGDSIGRGLQFSNDSAQKSLTDDVLDDSRYGVPKNSVLCSVKIVLLSNKMNLLMPFGILAIVIDKVSGNSGWVFLLSLVGIMPLAERLGFLTEQLAFFTGPTVGGLLNATFGNATELIISIHALERGMIRVVQQSLLGSILSNMLLVLGCAFFSGGLVFVKRQQVFDKGAASVNSGLLLMAVMGLLFPAVLHSTHTETHFGRSELALSRLSSCIMLVAYASYISFQLKSQKYLNAPVNEEKSQNWSNDEEEGPEISRSESVMWLILITACISVLSEYLVNTIQGTTTAWNIPIAFISVVLLPIVGNAAEHASAIMFAMKDKLDISLGVAIGSSTQISMFGIPFLVVVGWIMGRPMDLNFQLFETATLFITVLVVAFMLQEGTSNYLKGLMLILSYLIVAASFFVHRDPVSIGEPPKPSD